MKKWILLFIAGLLLVACNPKIVSYQNPRAAYRTFESYRLVSPKVDNNQLDSETASIFTKIKEEIEGQMSRRNYQLSSARPDLTLRYEVTSGTSVQTNVQQSFNFPGQTVNSRTITQSSLLLELLDQKNKLVWQGSYDLRQERKEKKVNRVIENAIGRIFTTYPYAAGNNQPIDSLTTYNRKKNK